jgi:hypothetical protein
MRTVKDHKAFAIPEPRIRWIAREIQRFQSIVGFESGGRPVTVDSFTLPDLRQWVTIPQIRR